MPVPPGFTIPQLYVEAFDANVRHLAQQTRSRLANTINTKSQKAETQYFDQVDQVRFQRKTSRFAATPTVPVTYYRRASHLFDWDAAKQITDMSDDIRMLAKPEAAVVTEIVNARNRLRDTNIINVLLSTVQRRDETRKSFDQIDIPASQKVAVDFTPDGTSVTSGLTLAKLIKMRSILGKSEDEALATGTPEIFFVHTQQQIDDLLNDVDQVSNSRYADVKALIDGKVNRFMGLTFIQTELLPKDPTTGVRTCMAYTRDTAIESVGMTDYINVRIRHDLSDSLEAYAMLSLGGVRMQEKTITVCYCAE